MCAYSKRKSVLCEMVQHNYHELITFARLRVKSGYIYRDPKQERFSALPPRNLSCPPSLKIVPAPMVNIIYKAYIIMSLKEKQLKIFKIHKQMFKLTGIFIH